MSEMKIVIISDTHGLHEGLEIPDGDILVHAGDCTSRGGLEEVAAFNAFLGDLPHPEKVVIAGNHDFAFERQSGEARALMTNCTYLLDEPALVAGIKFYGSPWQPWFFDWAFNLPRGEALAQKWARIPADTDVLITHGPPAGIGDRTVRGEDVGCANLAAAVQKVKPKLHVFGHIHEAYGRWTRAGTTFINASTCNLAYEPVNPPWIFEWEV